jgi:hypothetical protein
MKTCNANRVRLVLMLAFALLLIPAFAYAGNGNVPTAGKHGNFLTRHGTTYSPPKMTQGQTIGHTSGARGGGYGWFGLFGVVGLAGLWRLKG